MNKKKAGAGGLSRLLEGRGFYIILFLCIAAIGVSVYVLFFSDNEEIPEIDAGDYLQDPLEDQTGPDEDPSQSEQPEYTPPASEPDDALQPVVGEAEVEVPDEEPEETAQAESTVTVPVSPTPTPAALYVWPLNGKIATPFSGSTPIYDKTMGDWRVHNGIDIEAPVNTTVASMGSGTVLDIYDDALLGTTVVIDHGDGLKTVYANLMAKPTVEVSQRVDCGEIIGSVGSTAIGEWSIVSHLHFEVVKDGVQQNPEEYLP